MGELEEFAKVEKDKIRTETRVEVLDAVCGWLRLAGEERTALALRRAFDHWPRNHVCTTVDGECSECGRRW